MILANNIPVRQGSKFCSHKRGTKVEFQFLRESNSCLPFIVLIVYLQSHKVIVLFIIKDSSKKLLKLSSFEQEFRYLGRIFGFYQGNPFRCVHMFNKI